MFERDLILAIWESLVIFPSFDTFFLILELATQFIFKARSKPENLWKSNNFPARSWNQNLGIFTRTFFTDIYARKEESLQNNNWSHSAIMHH